MPASKSFFCSPEGVTLKSVQLLRDIPDESAILHPAGRVRSVIHGWFLFAPPKGGREGSRSPDHVRWGDRTLARLFFHT